MVFVMKKKINLLNKRRLFRPKYDLKKSLKKKNLSIEGKETALHKM